MASIYGLYDAQGSLRYIGKANAPHLRLKSHMRVSKRRNTPLYAWIRKHGQPVMAVLEADCEDWAEAEKRHIADSITKGARLLNLAKGGDEPFCSKNTRQKNGRQVASAIHSCPKRKRLWELKQQLASLIREGAVSDQTKAKMRARPDVFGQWLHLI